MPRTQEIVRPDGLVEHRKPVAGDMRWDGAVWRRWSGRLWAKAAYSLHPDRLRSQTAFHLQTPIDERACQRALSLAVEDQVLTNGATVVLDGPHGVVLAYRRRVSHLFHAVTTVCTGGLWGIVWIVMALNRTEDRIRLEVDRWGNVWARPGSEV